MQRPEIEEMETKVFCIGFHKTGTTSLAVALKTLGYRVTGPNGVHDPDIAGEHPIP
jgi:UDP-N-acetylmuramate-alanine ligase